MCNLHIIHSPSHTSANPSSPCRASLVWEDATQWILHSRLFFLAGKGKSKSKNMFSKTESSWIELSLYAYLFRCMIDVWMKCMRSFLLFSQHNNFLCILFLVIHHNLSLLVKIFPKIDHSISDYFLDWLRRCDGIRHLTCFLFSTLLTNFLL